MFDLSNNAISQLTYNPGLLVLTAAAIGLAIVALHEYLSNGTPQISVGAASITSLAMITAFACLKSLQSITAIAAI